MTFLLSICVTPAQPVWFGKPSMLTVVACNVLRAKTGSEPFPWLLFCLTFSVATLFDYTPHSLFWHTSPHWLKPLRFTIFSYGRPYLGYLYILFLLNLVVLQSSIFSCGFKVGCPVFHRFRSAQPLAACLWSQESYQHDPWILHLRVHESWPSLRRRGVHGLVLLWGLSSPHISPQDWRVQSSMHRRLGSKMWRRLEDELFRRVFKKGFLCNSGGWKMTLTNQTKY